MCLEYTISVFITLHYFSVLFFVWEIINVLDSSFLMSFIFSEIGHDSLVVFKLG